MSIIEQIIKENKLKLKEEIKSQDEEIFERDERGNIIHYKDSDGYEFWKKYDSNNNVVHCRNSDGDEYWQEYDSNNNKIHYKDSDGYEYWQDYDSNNNVINKLELLRGKYYLNNKEMIKEV